MQCEKFCVVQCSHRVWNLFSSPSPPMQISQKPPIVFAATCGGSYYGGTGVITSHDYPSTYQNNEDCEWTLRGLRGHYLTLTFDALDVEGSGNCSDGDYIEIRDLNATGGLSDILRSLAYSKQWCIQNFREGVLGVNPKAAGANLGQPIISKIFPKPHENERN